MSNFLYVFSERDRDALRLLNYALLKSDEIRKIYVFENSDELHFDKSNINAVLSNVLTF